MKARKPITGECECCGAPKQGASGRCRDCNRESPEDEAARADYERDAMIERRIRLERGDW